MADAQEQAATRAAPVPILPPVPNVNWAYDEKTGHHVWMHPATEYEHLLFGGNSFWPPNQRERYTGGEHTIETFIARYGRAPRPPGTASRWPPNVNEAHAILAAMVAHQAAHLEQ